MSGRTLKYFMWGYQPHFQGEVQRLAEKLLKALDPRFEPTALLVGFLRETDSTSHPICLEPEECSYSPEQFRGVDGLAEQYRREDPESNTFHTLPEGQQGHDKRLKRRCQQRALLSTFDGVTPSNLISFCSGPERVGTYDVFVVLQVQRSHYESHYRLKKEIIERSRVARSYLDATISAILSVSTVALGKPEPGQDIMDLYHHAKHVSLDAAEYFATRLRAINWRHSGDYFETLNRISALRYEQAEGRGTLLIAQRGHENVQCDVEIAEPIPLSEHRAVRKLVEISSRGVSLLCDGWDIYGFGELIGEYDIEREDLFQVIFTEHHDWSIIHGDEVMMRVAFNRPLPLLPKLDSDKFSSDVRRIFHGIEDVHLAQLLTIVLSVIDLGHGCQIIIDGRAEDEAERLAPQATRIEPKLLDIAMIMKLCAIDGALLFDPQGYCHAVGVILDGQVSHRGDRSRGSRYNSAIRYAEGREQCVILVVSDDGTIDLIPKLRPQLRRQELIDVMDRVERIVANDTVDEDEFRIAMNWLNDHRFYISRAQGLRLNTLRDLVVSRRESELGRIYIVYNDFIPHRDMNDSYLIGD